MSILNKVVAPGGLCFDIGAYNGEKANEMVNNCGASKVIAVEPQANLLQFYSTNKITVVQKAISNKQGRVDFSVCDTAYTISTMSEHWKYGRFSGYKWSKTINVEVTTLDKLIEEYGEPDFCKIDVEGHEHKVLQGLSTPISCLSFEFTGEFVNYAYECIEILLNLSKSYTFNLTTNQQSPPDFDLTDWLAADKILEHLRRISAVSMLVWGDIYAKLG